MGRITSIAYKPATDDKGVGDYVRVPIGDAKLVAGFGIEGDLKGGSPGRHLNVLSQQSVDEMAADGYNAEPGAFGEQIIISGIDVDSLGSGDQIRLGATAVVKVSQRRNGCSKLEANQGKSRDRTEGKLGVMVDVVESGEIQVGDNAELVN